MALLRKLVELKLIARNGAPLYTEKDLADDIPVAFHACTIVSAETVQVRAGATADETHLSVLGAIKGWAYLRSDRAPWATINAARADQGSLCP